MDGYEDPVLVDESRADACADHKVPDPDALWRRALASVRSVLIKGITEATTGDESTVSTEYYCTFKALPVKAFANIANALRPEFENAGLGFVVNKTVRSILVKVEAPS